MFDVFSKRNKSLPDTFTYDDLPTEFRNQVLWIWRDSIFKISLYYTSTQRQANRLLNYIHKIVCEEHGLLELSNEGGAENQLVDALLNSDNLVLVLDIIELTFRAYPFFLEDEDENSKPATTPEDAVAALNHRFREHGLGYEFNKDSQCLIRIDNTVTHTQAIQPALHLLAATEYKTANEEFLEALEDFKKHDYDDCLTKCCSAFESVMKIICDKKGWPYQQNDTAKPLISTIITNTGLPTFFADPLTLIATLRNRLSKSHGQGTQPKSPDDFIARYAINATASAILLLHEAANK
ncbi:STM4504/CBY_0614 family protein [Anatilimnocola floriformis]|uniref:STM4504/CBY_0614 family protein n=1 Tax=Anatilimnocola floriformis TaxID=2948575 RepID=UPI0020C40809|nr:hypothetical protein [Anatilimnocola floriformis]